MKIKFILDTGCPGVVKEEIVELPDNTKEREIESWYQLWVWGIINGSWSIVK